MVTRSHLTTKPTWSSKFTTVSYCFETVLQIIHLVVESRIPSLGSCSRSTADRPHLSLVPVQYRAKCYWLLPAKMKKTKHLLSLAFFSQMFVHKFFLFSFFFFNFSRIQVLFVGPLVLLFWTSGDVCPGFQSQGGFPRLRASLPAHNRFLRFCSQILCISLRMSN